mmetsp:Transcript_40100/g.93896  ORF Transcript_40100/g.93896 Transcript_40100/m.93896 type:complete len:382 (+) Transcript_40100:329-1474(+)|eukprot:CAMPEP_0172016544 /NCGR_PEP_ID=MMETSP1041-20130122/11081_1 /TAXON_ID=464988 /ORGANISM="Hemiselmis andersenii, Strain CCMP439" /LENGTH=381 /DNA_ID=CAMNT_0012671501 /DNA_START=328 /DNA_END=1473 /DNA_ORIENTATION=-
MLKSINRLAEKVESTFSKHSGASDIVIVKHADGELRTTPWFVHCDGQIQPHDTRVQVRVCIGGKGTELFMSVGRDHQCSFHPSDLDAAAASYLPSESQLQMLPLVPGKNEAVFEVRQLEENTQRWSVQSAIEANIFLWEATDRVVAFDYEGALLRSDAWAKEAKEAMLGTKKATEWDGKDKSGMHDGVGSLLSSLNHGGYRILITTNSPISRMSNRRSAISAASSAEVDRWGDQAELPDIPVMCGTDHTAAVLAKKLASKALAVAGKQGKQNDCKRSSLSLVADLFRIAGSPDSENESGGGFAGGFCRSEDVEAFVDSGVPVSGIVAVDRFGTSLQVVQQHGLAQAGWKSFGEFPAATMFPSLCKSSPGSRDMPSPGVLLL